MEGSIFSLYCHQQAHSQDIKSVCTIPRFFGQCESVLYNILSGSRDTQVKLWMVEEDSKTSIGRNIQLVKTYQHHNGYVNCVGYIHPDPVHKQGLLVSSGSDKVVYVYEPCIGGVEDKPSSSKIAMSGSIDGPKYILVGHEDNISHLSFGEEDLIVSSSWDNTLRVWENYICKYVLQGHSSCVWCSIIMYLEGYSIIISGSGDHNIKIWKEGVCIQTLTGHKDAVRSIVSLSSSLFASASNDYTVRIWDLHTNTCLHELVGQHTSFIYTLCKITLDTFVSAGEDKKINIWCDNVCIQSIKTQAFSVWSACRIEGSSEFVTGGSDGTIDIYGLVQGISSSKNTIRLENTKEEVSSLEISTLLPEIDREGATRFLKEAGEVCVYRYEKQEWHKVGNIVQECKSDLRHGTKKQIHNGKEYDFVFTVDIEDNAPCRMLPYNIGDNISTSAQNFIHENNLPQVYHSQIVNFLEKNTNNNHTSGNSFSKNLEESPISSYIVFDVVNVSGIIKKLQEFNSKILIFESIDFQRLGEILRNPLSSPLSSDLSIKMKNYLRRAETNTIFPIIDILRVISMSDVSLANISEKDGLIDIIEFFYRLEDFNSHNCKTLARWIVNLFYTNTGRSLIVDNVHKISRIFTSIKFHFKDNNIISAFIHNFSLLSEKHNELLAVVEDLTC